VNAELDPLFWQQISSTATERDAADVLGQFMEDVNAHGPDSEFPWPSPVSNSAVFRRDPELAVLLTRTEMAFLEYYQNGRPSQHRGLALLDLLRHLEFDPNDFHSTNIVHLLRQLERPYAEATLHTYSLWKEGDGNQKLDLVVRDYLEVFREVMRNRQWKLQFELSFRALFAHLTLPCGGKVCRVRCPLTTRLVLLSFISTKHL